MNRLASHIDSLRPRVAALDPDAAAKLDAEMAIEPFEHFQFQEEQARAHASGKLTADEAMIVYTALGEAQSESNGGWQPDVDTATKVSITLLMGELVKARMGMRF